MVPYFAFKYTMGPTLEANRTQRQLPHGYLSHVLVSVGSLVRLDTCRRLSCVTAASLRSSLRELLSLRLHHQLPRYRHIPR
jgi:hypothetical protein